MSLTKIVKGVAPLCAGIAMLSCGEMQPEVSQPESSNLVVTPVVKQEVPVRKPAIPEEIMKLPGFDCYTIDEKGNVKINSDETLPEGYVCLPPYFVEKKALPLINPLLEKTGLSTYELLRAAGNGDLIVSYQELHNFANLIKSNEIPEQ